MGNFDPKSIDPPQIPEMMQEAPEAPEAPAPQGPFALETLATGTLSCNLLIGLPHSKGAHKSVTIRPATGELVAKLEGLHDKARMSTILKLVLQHCVVQLGNLPNPPIEILSQLTLADAQVIALLIMAVETDDTFSDIRQCPHCKQFNKHAFQATKVLLTGMDSPVEFQVRPKRKSKCATAKLHLTVAGKDHEAVLELPTVGFMASLGEQEAKSESKAAGRTKLLEAAAERLLISLDGGPVDLKTLPFRLSYDLYTRSLAAEHPSLELFQLLTCPDCGEQFETEFPLLGWTAPFVLS